LRIIKAKGRRTSLWLGGRKDEKEGKKDKLRKEARTLSTLYLALFLPFQVSLQEFNLFLQIFHKYLKHKLKLLLHETNY
jgi:hypothetical protein